MFFIEPLKAVFLKLICEALLDKGLIGIGVYTENAAVEAVCAKFLFSALALVAKLFALFFFLGDSSIIGFGSDLSSDFLLDLP